MDEQKKRKDPIWRHTRIGMLYIGSAHELWEAACRYFEWADDNPVESPASLTRQQRKKEGQKMELRMSDYKEDITRPYTLYGLCAFLGIQKWSNFKDANLGKDGYAEVIDAIENTILSQQIDGAMTGVFRENIVCRINGIQDSQRSEIELTPDKQFTGFGFLPITMGLPNSPKQIEEKVEELPEPEKEPMYAEVVDVNGKTETPIWDS